MPGILIWHTCPVSLDVSPQLLKALRAVVETGSLTAAADRLGYTQSGLSKQIAALEHAAGAALFIRRPRGVEATEAGRRLSVRAATVLDQLDAAERELETLDTTVGGSVTLGGFPTTAMRLAPAAIARARLLSPEIDVEFVESSTPVQLRRLRAGRLDLGIIAVGPDLPDWDTTGMELEELPSGELVIAISERHALAHRSSVTVDDLTDEVWVIGAGAPGDPQFGAWPTLPAPHIGVHLREWSARLGFVAAGLGVTTVPALVASTLPAGVVAVKVEDSTFAGRSMHLAHIGQLSPAAATLREAIIREAGRIADG